MISSSVRSSAFFAGSMPALRHDLARPRRADAVDVAQRILDPLFPEYQYQSLWACLLSPLTLSLLVARIGADDPHHALAPHHLAPLTNPSHRAAHFHRSPLHASHQARLGHVERRHSTSTRSPGSAPPSGAASPRARRPSIRARSPIRHEKRVSLSHPPSCVQLNRFFRSCLVTTSRSAPPSPTAPCARSGPTGCRSRGHDRPPVVQHLHLPAAQVDHRLDGQGHARPPAGPRPGGPKFGICGSSCMRPPDPVPHEIPHHARTLPPVAAVSTACEMSDSRPPATRLPRSPASSACSRHRSPAGPPRGRSRRPSPSSRCRR